MNLCELVPRDLETLLSETKTILRNFDEISGINVPDVLRLDNRSYDVAARLLDEGVLVIPHIRTIDHPLEDTVEIVSRLVEKGLERVLIVTGDSPISMSKKVYPVRPTEVVESLKKKYPELKVYCALDPYRQSFQKELAYCKQKIKAGADGFFSQPFFDPELARIYIEQLKDSDFFLGLSPVTSEASLNYWITRNKAIFPDGFQLDLESNCQVGKELIQLAEEYNKNTYLMPIKVSAIDYLNGLFR